MRLAVNKYAFHWSFPEILADSLGLFAKRGVKVNWRDATPDGVVDKTSMYTDLLREGLTDVYHAAEWGCINRVLKSEYSWIIAKSPPGEGTLNSSFALYSLGDATISSPEDLAGKSVAIEEGTGAQYTTILDLEPFVPAKDLRLVQTGEPHRRLKALLAGDVDAASLVGPWADIGKALGLKLILKTARTNPTTIVVRRDTDSDLLKGFFGATNEAIGLIDSDPSRYREEYFRRVETMLGELDLPVEAESLKEAVTVPRWEKWAKYEVEDFEKAYRWMVRRGLAQAGRDATGLVGVYPPSVFE